MKSGIYLDWNASAPLRPEARAAMLMAMDTVGNPSSVHGAGRKARAIVEHARGQVAEALGAMAADVVFTSGATEAATLALGRGGFFGSMLEHDSVLAWTGGELAVMPDGAVQVQDPSGSALQAANSETGIVQDLPQGIGFVDAVQVAGKLPFSFDWLGAERAAVSAHKLGGPKGVGALIVKSGIDIAPVLTGGGQEQGRRAGTENVIGIAGFGAACEAAARDIADGVWEQVSQNRDLLEATILDAVPDAIIVGKNARRLPNTSCIVVAGWKSETQVMQMDLAGFAVSAGSACSSGKVRRSRVLEAMGFSEARASGAIRVSTGPDTTRKDVMDFAAAWIRQNAKFQRKVA